MTAPAKLVVATALREAMEDRRLRLPEDQDLRLDLHSVRMEVGPTGAGRLVAERADSDGHADRFWALALACGAAAEGKPEYAYDPVLAPRTSPRSRPWFDRDDDYASEELRSERRVFAGRQALW